MYWLLWGKVSQMLFFIIIIIIHICFYDLIIPPQADVQSLMSWFEA